MKSIQSTVNSLQQKLKIKNRKSLNGFTLIELLVVVAVLSIAGILIVTAFTSSLRGSNKSQIVSSIKQNGQSVLEQMDKAIRNSDNIVCPSISIPSGSTLVFVKDGIFTRYRFFVADSASNGSIQQDTPVQPSPPFLESDIKLFTENVCTNPLEPPVNILTDTNTSSGVSLKYAKDSTGTDLPFIVRENMAGFKDRVTIQFALKPGSGVAQAVSGQIDPITFKTTIELR